MEDEESLETSAVIRELTYAIEAEIDYFFANRVVATGEVVGRVFLTAYELLRVEQLAVLTGSHFVDHGWFEIYEDGAGDVLPGAGLAEESVKGVVSSADCFVARHLSVRLT